jgi:hypothetical protein
MVGTKIFHRNLMDQRTPAINSQRDQGCQTDHFTEEMSVENVYQCSEMVQYDRISEVQS